MLPVSETPSQMKESLVMRVAEQALDDTYWAYSQWGTKAGAASSNHVPTSWPRTLHL